MLQTFSPASDSNDRALMRAVLVPILHVLLNVLVCEATVNTADTVLRSTIKRIYSHEYQGASDLSDEINGFNDFSKEHTLRIRFPYFREYSFVSLFKFQVVKDIIIGNSSLLGAFSSVLEEGLAST